uniref:LRR binding FLII interacting protein 1 n=1 Tax=Hippocampus comes TaxID=109280 RepID=A0A3Q2XTR5_HIPCM
MGTQGAGRKRNSNKERSTAEDDALNLIAREAEARLAAKRAARAEAREIRMRELERQQKEIFQVQKKYYGLNPKSDDRSDSKWGDIEQWMEDSERYSRPSQPHTLSDDDERMSVGSRGSARSSSSLSHKSKKKKKHKHKEKDRNGHDDEYSVLSSRVDDRDYLEKGSRAASALTAATLASLGGTSSRRASVETAITVDAETATREIKEALTEVEEKYRKAMVSNAQLDNEKNNLMYQVDTLKDSLIELEELLSESRREYEEKVKDFEREKHAHSVLQFQFNEMKETLKQSEELLNKHGIVLGPDLSLNGDTSETETDVATSGGDAAPQQAQASPTSPSEGNSMLEIRLRKLVDEREKMIEQMKKLKAQVDQKSQKNGTDGSWSAESEPLENGNDPNIIELQRDSSRQISDMKFKLVKAEQEVTALEQNVSRLEGQVSRYKSAAENAEKVEDELKAEKRKLQRELRSALDKVDELESNNSHLNKRLEKMKSSRGMAQTP